MGDAFESGLFCGKESATCLKAGIPSSPSLEVKTPTAPIDDFTLIEVYRKLQQTGVDFVLIGGQAVAIWTEKYLPKETPCLTADLDFYADIDPRSKLLSIDIVLIPKPKRLMHTPVTCSFQHISENGNETLVQILRSLYGVQSSDVLKTKQPVVWKDYGITLNLVHPLLLMEDKLSTLFGLPQTNRRDYKHLEAACLFVPEFIKEQIKREKFRDSLKMCQHILKLAESDNGKMARQRGIHVESAIPLGALKGPTLEKFANNEYQRRIEIINRRAAKEITKMGLDHAKRSVAAQMQHGQGRGMER